MKRTVVLMTAFLFATMAFAGCGSDNATGSGGLKDQVVGEWKSIWATYTFRADGTWEEDLGGGVKTSGTWKVSGDKIVMSWQGQESSEVTISGDTMTLKDIFEGDEETATRVK